MSRGGYERGKYRDGSTYDSWDEEPDTMYIYYHGNWVWESGYGVYQLAMHRNRETGEWDVAYQGMPPPFVERSSLFLGNNSLLNHFGYAIIVAIVVFLQFFQAMLQKQLFHFLDVCLLRFLPPF